MKRFLSTIIVFAIVLSLSITSTFSSSAKELDLINTSLEYTYDPDAAIAFAKQHCKTDALNHSAVSGESACDRGWLCAEFVAECLRAGGFPKKLSAVAGLSGFGGQILNYGKKSQVRRQDKMLELSYHLLTENYTKEIQL